MSIAKILQIIGHNLETVNIGGELVSLTRIRVYALSIGTKSGDLE